MTVIVSYVRAGALQQTEDLSAVAEAISEGTGTVWIDADEKSAALEAFLEQLGLHPLTMEDIVSEQPTPKIEEASSYVYLVMHEVRPNAREPLELQTAELDLVLGNGWLFTHHSVPAPSIAEFHAEVQRNPQALACEPAFVAHAIIDRLTDNYLPVIDRFDDEIDQLETSMVQHARRELLGRLFVLKRSLQRLRRIAVYQREMMLRMARGEFAAIPAPVRHFYRDVYDHFVRIADVADSHREAASAALEIYLTVAANRTNDIMKVLALISTLMLPLSFITGVYGMNFRHMPELDWRFGYPAVLALMALVALGLLAYFRRRGWI